MTSVPRKVHASCHDVGMLACGHAYCFETQAEKSLRRACCGLLWAKFRRAEKAPKRGATLKQRRIHSKTRRFCRMECTEPSRAVADDEDLLDLTGNQSTSPICSGRAAPNLQGVLDLLVRIVVGSPVDQAVNIVNGGHRSDQCPVGNEHFQSDRHVANRRPAPP